MSLTEQILDYYVKARDHKSCIRLMYLSYLLGIEVALHSLLGEDSREWRLAKSLIIRLERVC